MTEKEKKKIKEDFFKECQNIILGKSDKKDILRFIPSMKSAGLENIMYDELENIISIIDPNYEIIRKAIEDEIIERIME
jgi:hypothetical protein